VWSADGRSVRDVIVDGRVVVRDKQCVTVDVGAARADAEKAAAALFERAGITVPHRWPHVTAADLDQ
jgi:5-methylthioadenosine/S-adenosylhomocysteine deaminase